jgi:hypothetical protein
VLSPFLPNGPVHPPAGGALRRARRWQVERGEQQSDVHSHRLKTRRERKQEGITRPVAMRLRAQFGDDYWYVRDTEGGFPHEFHRAMTEARWLRIAPLGQHGGGGLGIAKAVVPGNLVLA